MASYSTYMQCGIFYGSCAQIPLKSSCAHTSAFFPAVLLQDWQLWWTLPAMQWHAYKRFLAFLSGNLAPLFLRLQDIFNVFKFRLFVKSLAMLIDSLLTAIFFSCDQKLIFKTHKTFRKWARSSEFEFEAENATSKRRPVQPPLPFHKEDVELQRRGKLTMSSRLAGWSPRLC